LEGCRTLAGPASGTGVNSTRSAAMVYIEGRLEGWLFCFTHYILSLQTLFRFQA
jgi:hypothetical protein